MELKIEFTESAFGHRIAEADIRHAIANKIRERNDKNEKNTW
jgi:hypothetical protein